MSEPVKNAEIEDVLSSIRRLVSEDQRKTVPQTDAVRPVAPTRFVLTEALRVEDPEPDESLLEPAVEEDTGAVDPDIETHAEPTPALAEREMSSDAAFAELRDEVETHLTMPAEDEAPDESQFDEESDKFDAEEEATSEPLETTEELELSEELTATSEEAQDDQPWADPDTTLYEAAGLASDDSVDEGDDTGTLSEDDVQPLGDKIAALEKLIARKDDHWEPDDPGVDDYAGTDVETLEWEDTTPEDLVEMPAPSVGDVQFEAEEIEDDVNEDDEEGMIASQEDDLDLSREDALLDEDALRELVADIVREELQGALGERITRNVRKLVRREIQRALAVQDLE